MGNGSSITKRRLTNWWICFIGICIGVAIQSAKSARNPTWFMSQARLYAAEGRNKVGCYALDFLGATVETLESPEMHRRALDRVRALHPNVREARVTISANRTKSAVVLDIRASSLEPQYTQLFLDALLDEFLAFHDRVREQQKNRAVSNLVEDVSRRHKALEAKNARLTEFEKTESPELLRGELNRLAKRALDLRHERDDVNGLLQNDPQLEATQKQRNAIAESLAGLESEIRPLTQKVATHDGLVRDYQDAKRGYDELLDLLRRFTVQDAATSDSFFVDQRASGAVADVQNPILMIGAGAFVGGVAGFLLSRLIALLLRGSKSSVPPPAA